MKGAKDVHFMPIEMVTINIYVKKCRIYPIFIPFFVINNIWNQAAYFPSDMMNIKSFSFLFGIT